MFKVLLESRGRRPRRSGGVALSVVAHVAVIGAATAATAHRPSSPLEKPEAVILHLAPPPVSRAPVHRVPPSAARGATAPRLDQALSITTIEVPTTVPVSLPEIDLARHAAVDSIIIGSSGSATPGERRGMGLLAGDGADAGSEWRGTELQMHILSSARPRYPEPLRQAGVGGRVLVIFTVDTLGRVERGSIRVVSSTHDLFTASVKAALPEFRFRPSMVNGRRVPALAEMPFEFSIAR